MTLLGECWATWGTVRQLAQLEYCCGRTDISCLVKAGRADEDRGLSSMSGSSWHVWNLIGQTTGWSSSCGSGTEDGLVRATDHAIQVRKYIKSSLNNSVSLYIIDPGSCYSLTSAGKATQQDTSSQDFLIQTLDEPEITQSWICY